MTANYIGDPCVILHLQKGGTQGITPEETEQLIQDLKEALKALREE